MKKISSLVILIAIAGMVSLNAFAYTSAPAGFGDFGFHPFGYGYSFGGFGYGMDFGGFARFNHAMDFGGFGMGFAGFGDFGYGMGFTAHNAGHELNRKIVPLPPTASAENASITYDENGEIHVRPFDDEDLFVED